MTAAGSTTLTASNITDPDLGSIITQVAFYVVVNGTETLLGYGTQNSPGVWTFNFTVNLAAGTYSGPLVLTRSVILSGAGSGATILQGQGTGIGVDASGPGIVLRGLTIRGFQTGLLAGNVNAFRFLALPGGLAVTVIPVIVYFALPGSPRWHLRRGRPQGAGAGIPRHRYPTPTRCGCNLLSS